MDREVGCTGICIWHETALLAQKTLERCRQHWHMCMVQVQVQVSARASTQCVQCIGMSFRGMMHVKYHIHVRTHLCMLAP